MLQQPKETELHERQKKTLKSCLSSTSIRDPKRMKLVQFVQRSEKALAQHDDDEERSAPEVEGKMDAKKRVIQHEIKKKKLNLQYT